MHHARLGSASALFACALLSLASTPACAQVPDPDESTFDAIIVGNVSGTAIGGSPPGFDAVMIDTDGDWLAGRPLNVDFSATGIRVFQVQNSGTTVNCAARTVSRITDILGRVNIAARFGGYSNGNAVEVHMDGVVLRLVKARSTDIDAIDGTTGLNDFVLFVQNFISNPAAQETDFDLNGSTGLGDFTIFAQEFVSGAVGNYCPQ